MNIETVLTPNPETLKFMVDKTYIFQSGIEIKNEKEAKKFKFTKDCFQLKGIKRIFIGENFITITKEKNITWNNYKKREKKNRKNKISIKIEKIIDEKVRPAVARDGGDIIFESFDKGIVYLTLKGACVGCPSSTATLKQGIENLLTHYFSEVKEVKSL